MAESSLYFSVMSMLVKLAGEREVPWEQIVFARSIFALVVTFTWLRLRGIDPWGNRRGWLVSRGMLGVVGLMCFYYSITHLPLGDATVIQFSNPAFVSLFAVFLLGENLRPRDILATAICIGGVALIAEPRFLFGGPGRLPIFPVTIAVVGAMVSAMAYTVVRRLGRSEHPLVTVLYFPLVAAPITLPLAVLAGRIPDLLDLAVLLGVGISSQAAQVRMTQGLTMERAARATAVTYLQVVFAFIWGLTFFGEVPAPLTLLGAAIIVLTTLAVAVSRSPAAVAGSAAEKIDVDGEDPRGAVHDLDEDQR